MIGTQENLPPINEQEVDYSIPKLIVILLVGAAIAVGLGYSLVFGGFVRMTLWSAGLLIFLSLQSLFVKDIGRLALFLFIETAALSGAIFYWNMAIPLKPFGVGVAAFYIFTFLASRSGRAESESSLKVSFSRISRSVISGSLVGLLILEGVMLSIVINPSNEQWVSKKSFEKNFSQPVIAITKPFFPGISASMKTGDFLNKFAENNAVNITIGGISFAKLSAASQKQYLGAVTGELQKTIQGFTGVPLNLTSSVSDNLYTIAKAKLGGFVKSMSSWVFIASITVIFLITIESFAWFFNWILALIAWIFYEIFLFFGFARICLENRSRETVILR
jgi:hypothetical protein